MPSWGEAPGIADTDNRGLKARLIVIAAQPCQIGGSVLAMRTGSAPPARTHGASVEIANADRKPCA